MKDVNLRTPRIHSLEYVSFGVYPRMTPGGRMRESFQIFGKVA